MHALPPGSVVLRPAGPSDCRCIADILIDARKAFMPYAPSAHAEADVHDWVAAVLVPGGGVTVATGDDAVVGVMAVSRRDGFSWIEQLSVTPRLVGQGIGSELLRHALSRLPPPIRLYTFQANAGARRFYARNGFEAIAFGNGDDNEERCPDVLFERTREETTCRPRTR